MSDRHECERRAQFWKGKEREREENNFPGPGEIWRGAGEFLDAIAMLERLKG